MKHLTGNFVKLEYATFLYATKAAACGKIEIHGAADLLSAIKRVRASRMDLLK
jgi:hypothetical protein